MLLYLKKFFHVLIMSFLAKNQKIFNVGKLRKYDEAVRQKNVFIFLKAFFTKMGRPKIRRWQPAVLFWSTSKMLNRVEVWLVCRQIQNFKNLSTPLRRNYCQTWSSHILPRNEANDWVQKTDVWWANLWQRNVGCSLFPWKFRNIPTPVKYAHRNFDWIAS